MYCWYTYAALPGKLLSLTRFSPSSWRHHFHLHTLTFTQAPSLLPSHPHIYPHTLTLTLTTETPINRAFQAESEGVRVEKEKKYFYFLFVFLPVFSCCIIAIHDFKMELVYIHLYLLSPSGKNQPYLLCISPERSSGFLMCFYDCLQSFACLSAIRHHDATVLTGYPDVLI